MNILVIGAGAIGCLVGGRLAAAGCQVTLLGRPALADAVTQGGLRLQWPGHDQQIVHPMVITDLQQLPDLAGFELILITVKAFATQTAVTGLAGRLTATARLLSLQNGVGNEAALAVALPGQPIIAGSITLPVQIPQLGTVVVAKAKGGIGLAPFTPGVLLSDVANILQQAGFTIEQYMDHRSLKWSKLLLNIIANASSAILDMPPGQSLAHPHIFDLELAALREAELVMRAQGIRAVRLFGYPLPLLSLALRWLPNSLLRRLLKPVIAGGRGDKLPSLQLDLRQGRNESEVTVLNEVVATVGEELALSVPVNRGLSDILTGIAHGYISWDAYRGQPEVLWQAIQRKQTPSAPP